ncbi:tRNA (adenine37-N(6))-methyltransferase TrmN6 [Photobacterium aphoticum]|nr:tRNA (adenine37-N(6))-methyltransferase TrmN6 [Photobacterium aphoticum]
MAKGFTFKQFHVNDHGCGMPVSTDGVLLGAWATLTPHAPILDIGCGSGILA